MYSYSVSTRRITVRSVETSEQMFNLFLPEQKYLLQEKNIQAIIREKLLLGVFISGQ